MLFSFARRHCNVLAVTLIGVGLWLPAGAAPSTTANTLLVVGDSLSAEYGLKRGSGWVALLQSRLDKEKRAVTVVNASISGDTTSGGRSRLDALLEQHRPRLVVIELGGNDALRGLPLGMTRDNLQAMTLASQRAGAKVVLVGMQVPPNYGEDYNRQMQAAYAEVAKNTKSTLVPFFLKGVADGPNAMQWFQADRIHPTEAAHPTMLANVWPAILKNLP
ncbi:arylesterase [Curvibacter sp. APW13]|uniref:arylesterase n=1 Tax=Curvibacter sp. APW13 TaxID=3077236 RepID=UPI0028DD74A1|nr:arylesterase [Curvibacter sp. APW13]MDT8991707.1 arylesterase [Curvibacter sp. APW13]